MLLALRFVKLLAVAALFTGTVGAFLPRDLADRRRFAFALAGPGFGLSWATGFGLAALTGASLLSTFILASLALSVVSLHFVLYSVGKDGRNRPLVATLAIAPLVAVVALMTWRPE